MARSLRKSDFKFLEFRIRILYPGYEMSRFSGFFWSIGLNELNMTSQIQTLKALKIEGNQKFLIGEFYGFIRPI